MAGSAVLELTDGNFEQSIAGSGTMPVLVDFGAAWCDPCRRLSPIVDEIAAEYAGVAAVGKVDIDANQDITTKYGVMNVPTLMFFKNGQPVDRMIGAYPKAKIVETLKRHI